MLKFQCACGARVFFENDRCLGCGRALGFLPEQRELVALELGARDEPSFRVGGNEFRRCGNAALGAGCNWLLPADSNSSLCQACSLNRTIPDLSVAGNLEKWRRVEFAKRRLVDGLNALGLPVESQVSNPDLGVAFDFLVEEASQEAVRTGHNDGVITLNLKEADPATREQTREAMNERYRTLLGHFRHEIGHRFFALLNDAELDRFRELFGDERVDYAMALARYYSGSFPAAFESEFISPYATAHPHEDWAEVWAHYLHMVDALETAEANDFSARRGTPPLSRRFDSLLEAWQELAVRFNELNRSLGHEDAYPFAISPRVRDKLAFVDQVVRAQRKPALHRARTEGAAAPGALGTPAAKPSG